jgi:hypothetical protein
MVVSFMSMYYLEQGHLKNINLLLISFHFILSYLIHHYQSSSSSCLLVQFQGNSFLQPLQAVVA